MRSKIFFGKISKFILSGVIVGIFGGFVGWSAPVFAESTCRDVAVVFARGSGEEIEGPSFRALKKALEEVFSESGSGVSYSLYDLGTRANSGYQYPAVAIDLKVATGAILSGGSAFSFGESVKQGVGELKNYVAKMSATCKNTKFALVGYSQGAMAVHQALFEMSSSKVLYAATMGDPELVLPEGFGGALSKACRRELFSNYRKDVPDCKVYTGLLTSLEEYLPGGYLEKLGTWCNMNDIMCGSGVDLGDIMGGHTSYSSHGKYREVAAVIARLAAREFRPGGEIVAVTPGIVPKDPEPPVVPDVGTEKPGEAESGGTGVPGGTEYTGGMTEGAGPTIIGKLKVKFLVPTDNYDKAAMLKRLKEYTEMNLKEVAYKKDIETGFYGYTETGASGVAPSGLSCEAIFGTTNCFTSSMNSRYGEMETLKSVVRNSGVFDILIVVRSEEILQMDYVRAVEMASGASDSGRTASETDGAASETGEANEAGGVMRNQRGLNEFSLKPKKSLKNSLEIEVGELSGAEAFMVVLDNAPLGIVKAAEIERARGVLTISDISPTDTHTVRLRKFGSSGEILETTEYYSGVQKVKTSMALANISGVSVPDCGRAR